MVSSRLVRRKQKKMLSRWSGQTNSNNHQNNRKEPMEDQPVPRCSVCRSCGEDVRLIRLVGNELPEGSETPEHFKSQMILATVPMPTDALVCEECIRDIKMLSLTEITQDGPHVFSRTEGTR